MDVVEAIHQRRSFRSFAGAAIARETLKQLVDAAIQAPSAMNEQPWSFTIIQNQALLGHISERAKKHMLALTKGTPAGDHYAKRLGSDDFHIFYHAPALVVISAPLSSRWAVEDCALAAQNLMLAAHAMKLGTCWVGFAQAWLGTEDGHAATGISPSFLPVAPIIIGYPDVVTDPVLRNAPNINWID
jgi:nitroreductase